MSNQKDVDINKLTGNVANASMAACDAFNGYIESRRKQRKISLGPLFFLIGCYLPYLFGLTHDPGDQFLCGVFFGIIGTILAVIINFRGKRHKNGGAY